MRIPTFCICENKDADQLRGFLTAKLISAFVFATWIVQSLYFLNFMTLDIFCGRTAWNASDQVGNKNVGFLMTRLSCAPMYKVADANAQASANKNNYFMPGPS